MEVLSPVKNLYAAKAVIEAGSDAIYFGSMSFGARKKASISKEEVKEIILYAKKRNVKTYTTMNTIIFQNEVRNFLSEVDLLYTYGVDGIILQDYSFIKLIKDHYPDLEVHASTQMNINNLASTSFVKNLGVNRVVLPREMSFENIKYINNNIDVETEVFIHGALCVAYSGLCYTSSLLDQKSANRGECSQYCRMESEIVNLDNSKVINKGSYPLSLKDLNNINNLDKYKECGIDSIKIEGRLKDVSYACHLTKNYKNKVLDKNYQSEDLEVIFNRSYTTGRIDSQNGKNLVNQDRCNNKGKLIGEVLDVIDNKDSDYLFYKYKIKISGSVNKLDNIRYVDEIELGQVIDVISSDGYIYSNVAPNINAQVFKTKDYELLKKYEKYESKNQRKVTIDVSIVITDQISYTIKDKTYYLDIKVMDAINRPTLISDIKSKLSKTKDQDFDINISYIYYEEDKFIKMSDLTILKNHIIDSYTNMILPNRKSNQINLNLKPLNTTGEVCHYIEVNTKDQYEMFKGIDGCIIIIGNLALLDEITVDNEDIILTPSVMYDNEDFEILSKYDNLCISELGSLNKYADKNLISNFTLNTTNINNQHKLIDMGVGKQILSPELDFDKLKDFGNKHSIINIYGKLPVMLMDYCPINLNKQKDCGNCSLCQKHNFAKIDSQQRQFMLKYAGSMRINLYDYKAINLLKEVNKLKDINISNFHIRLVDEDIKTLNQIKNYLINEPFYFDSYYLANFNKKVF